MISDDIKTENVTPCPLLHKYQRWLLNISCIALTILSASAFADMEKSVTLKLSFDQYSIPYTTFMINGYPVYTTIDTGSSFGFHLPESQLKKIKGLKKERTYRSTDVSGKVQNSIAYLAPTLDLNGIKLTNITVTTLIRWGMVISGEGELPESPAVGLGAFKDKQILLDYVSNSLTILDNVDYNSLIKDSFKEFTFQQSTDGLILDVEQSGHKYHMILDTGASVSVVWSERLKSREPASCLLVDPEMDNKGCEATRFETKSKDGNPEQLWAVVVAGNFEHMGNIDGLIGNNFLKERKIFIDFKNNKFFISNNKK
ncbi:hypothetical protein [Salmonella enterica]|uniref:hypothetical protein n=1 Tax=Salmonella enterica TaxID=28901 RepID=UPI0020CA7968|nr:hypothetical protein [Salmonella enterica]